MENCSELEVSLVKEEPVDSTHSVTPYNDCSEIDPRSHFLGSVLGSDGSSINVKEMDLKFLKIDGDLDEWPTVEQKESVQQPVSIFQRKPKNRKILNLRQAMKLARTYADLYSDDLSHSFPYQNFKGPTVLFQCPKCMLSGKCASGAAFLNLLRHISREHEDRSTILVACIMQRYAPYIDYMRRKIAWKTKRTYVSKLREIEHRKTF